MAQLHNRDAHAVSGTETITADGAAPPSSAADRQWFDALFAANAADIVRYLRRRGAGSDAEDLAAETLACAWRRRADVPRGFETPWLYRAASNLLANHVRKHAVSMTQAWATDQFDERPDAASDKVEDRDIALRALASLSERDREVLMLVAWEGCGRVELAAALRLSVGGADAALSRARARLQAAYAQALSG